MEELEKVYIIKSNDYDNQEIFGVFNNKEYASDLAKNLSWASNNESIYVEEIILDNLSPEGVDILMDFAQRIYKQKCTKED